MHIKHRPTVLPYRGTLIYMFWSYYVVLTHSFEIKQICVKLGTSLSLRRQHYLLIEGQNHNELFM